jgi:predicted Zn-dependent protease
MSRIAQLEDLFAADPDDPFLAYALAQEYVTVGRTLEGLMMYEHLVKSHPDYVPTYYHYASVLYGLGNRNEAVRLIEQGISAGSAAGDHHAVSEMKGLLSLWTLGLDDDED